MIISAFLTKSRNLLRKSMHLALAAMTFALLAANSNAQTLNRSQLLEGPANQPPALLRADLTVAAELVTLGDLFENAGYVANKPVFRAPSIGQSGTIRADRVIRAARLAGLERIDQNNVSIVKVSRASQLVTEGDVIETLTSKLKHKGYVSSSGRVDVELNRSLPDQHASIEAVNPFTIRNLRFDRTTGRFTASVSIGGRSDVGTIRIAGRASETMLVPVMTRNLRRGEIIEESDIVMTPMPKRQAMLAKPAPIKSIIGKAARQSLRAGAIANASYFMLPHIIERSDIVTITFKSGNLSVSMRGKALSPGAKGDVIKVQNLQTNRIIQGTVSAPGELQINPIIQSIAALGAEKQ